MNTEYLSEIKARCEAGRPTARIDVKALIAEVERLTVENAALENDKINAEMNLENLTAEVEGLNAGNATLKKALELAARHIIRLTANSDCQMKENSEYCSSTISCTDCIQQHFIEQAEQLTHETHGDAAESGDLHA